MPDDDKFMAEYSREKHVTGAKRSSWICKPVEPSRGTGIIISSDIKDLVFDDTYVVRKYTCHPFLAGRGKPDLRICVCITGFKPLTIYVYQEGLARFATEKFDLSNLQNSYAPLTNLSISKSGPLMRKRSDRSRQQVDPQPVFLSLSQLGRGRPASVAENPPRGSSHGARRRSLGPLYGQLLGALWV